MLGLDRPKTLMKASVMHLCDPPIFNMVLIAGGGIGNNRQGSPDPKYEGTALIPNMREYSRMSVVERVAMRQNGQRKGYIPLT